MKQGYLSEYFDGVAIKRLSTVEADPTKSHQHEFQAVRSMLSFMGRSSEPREFAARFIYLTDTAADPVVDDSTLTLYDSRRKQPTRSPEYRFYFPDNAVTQEMEPGDLLVIAKRRDGGLMVLVAENDTSICSQIEWLFGTADAALPSLGNSQGSRGFSVRAELESDQDRIEFASRLILETLGIEVDVSDDSYLDQILARFGEGWPSTREFSPFARSLCTEVSANLDPDQSLIAWVDKEYVLYRTLEKHLISERIAAGFGGDDGVDEFLAFSLSVQNRRKSRSGSSLENHIEQVFSLNGLRYVRGGRTEGKSKPDFIFPTMQSYNDPDFPANQLQMLACKRSAKDRWRQILAEAARVQVKHLLTLEAAISTAQTDEMERQGVKLVLPYSLHKTFTSDQQKNLLSVADFVDLVGMSNS